MENIKVVIVEDDTMMAFLHKKVIIKNGISKDPVTFKNGKEAYDFLMEERGESGRYLVLLDLNMPVMNGWEFLDELKNENVSGQVRVVIVTSSTNIADRKKAEQYEMVDFYLSKPLFDLSPVQKTLAHLKSESLFYKNNRG